MMSSHPNVVQFYTSFVVEDKLWLVMEFMGAGSVADIMKFRFQSGLEETLIATIMKEALKGFFVFVFFFFEIDESLNLVFFCRIKYFHDTERIHRDVKAGNILVASSGDVKLADLGVAAYLVADGSHMIFVSLSFSFCHVYKFIKIAKGERKDTTRTFVGTPCVSARIHTKTFNIFFQFFLSFSSGWFVCLYLFFLSLYIKFLFFSSGTRSYGTRHWT